MRPTEWQWFSACGLLVAGINERHRKIMEGAATGAAAAGTAAAEGAAAGLRRRAGGAGSATGSRGGTGRTTRVSGRAGDGSPWAREHVVVPCGVAIAGSLVAMGLSALALFSGRAQTLAVAAFLATLFSALLIRFAIQLGAVAASHPHLRRAGMHRLTGERAAYVRTSQRLAMMDRDFTAADYEMLLDLDNNSTRLRRFLEGASQDFIDRLPTYTFEATKLQQQKSNVAAPSSSSSPPSTQTPPKVVSLSNISGELTKSFVDSSISSTTAPTTSGAQPDVCADDNTTATSISTTGDDITSGISACSDTKKIGASSAGATLCADELRASSSSPSKEPTMKHGSNPELGGDTMFSCAICLEDFQQGQRIRILPCWHRFMASCIDPWLLEQAKCPICKASIFHG